MTTLTRFNKSPVDYLPCADFISSTFYNERPDEMDINLLVIHNISLPQKQYGGDYINQLFTGTLSTAEHPSFESLEGLEVSTHLFIDREGKITQFVPFSKRAWHAGQSFFNGRERCNDFSLGIELEGCDDDYFTYQQYLKLTETTNWLCDHFPIQAIAGHSDIAPNRKTDPGPYFNWDFYKQCLLKVMNNEERTHHLFGAASR